MIRIFHLSTLRCRIAPLGLGDAAEIAGSLALPPEETHALLLGPGERRLLGVRDREDGRLHALILITRSSGRGGLALAPRVAAADESVPFAAEALAELLRALAIAHPFDRLEARCAAGDPVLSRLLAAQGFEQGDIVAGPSALRRAGSEQARIDVC